MSESTLYYNGSGDSGGSGGTNIHHGLSDRINMLGNASSISNTSTSLAPIINITTTGIPMPPSVIIIPPCQWILYEDIGTSRVRIWDLIILVPNALFLMFLLWNLKVAVTKLRNISSPIFTAFFLMVYIVSVISVLRCVVSMTVNATVLAGDIADKAFWLVLRFFLLATELSVIVFGLAFGHLDSQTSIRRVLVVTTMIAFIYSGVQGALEFASPDPKFRVTTTNYDIFGHGGMIFWMTSSAIFSLVYSTIWILPWTGLKDRLNLPSKKSFYWYALFLAVLNMTQTVGSSLLYTGSMGGMCVLDTTTYIYFTCFHPLVYGTFLREFFRNAQPGIVFSYKAQMDETVEEDTVSLPYQAAGGKLDYDEDSNDGSFDSTHFAGQSNRDVTANMYSGGATLSINTDYYQNPVV